MIKIKQAWYVKQLPQHVVAELLDARLVMFRLTPFRKVGEAEFIPYLGRHPSKCTSSVVPGYVLKHYGLEAEPLLPTKETGGLTTLEAEREYDLPEGTVRRDIHRGRFEAGEYQKVGRGWIVSREAIERVYKKEEVVAVKKFWLMEQTDSSDKWRPVVPAAEVKEQVWVEDLLEITGHQARTAEEIDDLAEKLTTKYREDNPADLGSWLDEMGYNYQRLRGYIDPGDLLVFDGADNSFQNLDYYPTAMVYEYLDSQSNRQYFVIQDQEGNLFADRIVVSEGFVNLDEWDGSNWQTGGVGLHQQVHKVIGQDIEDAFLVYRWSQWQGANPDGLLLTKDELIEHLEGLGRDVDEYLPKIESL